MAAGIFLVTKSGAEQPDNTIINDLHVMVVNADDGDSDAVIIAEAITVAVAAGHPIQSGYFNTVEQLGAPTGGIMTTDLDAIILLRRTSTQVIA